MIMTNGAGYVTADDFAAGDTRNSRGECWHAGKICPPATHATHNIATQGSPASLGFDMCESCVRDIATDAIAKRIAVTVRSLD